MIDPQAKGQIVVDKRAAPPTIAILWGVFTRRAIKAHTGIEHMESLISVIKSVVAAGEELPAAELKRLHQLDEKICQYYDQRKEEKMRAMLWRA